MSETVKTTIQFLASGQGNVEGAARDIESSVRRVSNALGELGPDARRNADVLKQGFDGARTRLQALRGEVENTAAEFDQLRKSAQGAASATERVGGGGGGGGSRGARTTALLDQAGRVGGQVASGLGGGAVGNSLGLFGDLAGVLGTLNPVLVAGAGAAAGMTIGIQILNSETRAAEQRLKAAVAAQQSYYSAVASLSSEQATQRIEQLRAELALQQQQAAETRAAYESNISGAGNILVDLGTTLGVSSAGAIQTLRGSAEELQQQAQTTTDTITRLEQGLASGAFAANDAASAEEALRQQRELAAQQTLAAAQQGVGSVLQFILANAGKTTGELQALLDDIRLDQATATAFRDYAQSVGITGEALQPVNDQLNTFRNQISAIEDNLLPAAAAAAGMTAATKQFTQDLVAAKAELERLAEAEAKAQSDRVDAYLASVKDTVEAREKASKAERELGDALAAGDARQKEIKDSLKNDVAKLESDAAAEELRQKEDLNEKLKRMRRDAGLDELDAIGDRDARSAILNRRRASIALGDAKTDADIEARRRRGELQRRENDLATSARRTLQLEADKTAREINLKQQASTRAQVDLLNALNLETLTRQQAFQRIVAASEQAGYDAAAAFTKGTQTRLAGGSTRMFTPMQTAVPYSGKFGAAAFAPRTVNLNVQGVVQKQIDAANRSQAQKTMSDVLTLMGVS